MKRLSDEARLVLRGVPWVGPVYPTGIDGLTGAFDRLTEVSPEQLYRFASEWGGFQWGAHVITEDGNAWYGLRFRDKSNRRFMVTFPWSGIGHEDRAVHMERSVAVYHTEAHPNPEYIELTLRSLTEHLVTLDEEGRGRRSTAP